MALPSAETIGLASVGCYSGWVSEVVSVDSSVWVSEVESIGSSVWVFE